MNIPEIEQYTELKTHLRYLNEKIIEAFTRFLIIASSIIGGVYYIHTVLDINDVRRVGIALPANLIVSLLGLGFIILIVTNLLSWHKYRYTLTEQYPKIPYERNYRTYIGEVFMCVVIILICAILWKENPLK